MRLREMKSKIVKWAAAPHKHFKKKTKILATRNKAKDTETKC